MGKRCKIFIVAMMIAAIAVSGGITTLGSAKADETSSEVLNTASYVTVNGATVTTQDLTVEGSSKTHKGLLISPETEGATYTGKINGIFSGDTKFTFTLPTEKRSNGAASYVDLSFRFAEVGNEDNYFDVEYYNCGWEGWYTAAAVKDNAGNYRTTNFNNAKTIYDSKYTANSDSVIYYPYAGELSDTVKGTSGYLGVEWGIDGVLNVYGLSYANNVFQEKYTIAKFDNETYSAPDGENGIYGLKKIEFKNGFTISYTAKPKNYNSKNITTPILLESITTKSSGGGERRPFRLRKEA